MAREIFSGHIPEGLLYDTTHDMWVRGEGELVVIGATAFGLHLAGKVIGFTSKPRGAVIERGRGLGTIECAKTVLAVRSPLSFELLEMNEALEETPAMINRDAYAAGWMSRGRPLAWASESSQLVDAAAYRAHIKRIEPAAEFT
jgi:glycine cleavage system H protein